MSKCIWATHCGGNLWFCAVPFCKKKRCLIVDEVAQRAKSHNEFAEKQKAAALNIKNINIQILNEKYNACPKTWDIVRVAKKLHVGTEWLVDAVAKGKIRRKSKKRRRTK